MMKSNAAKLNRIMQKIEQSTIVESIRTGLVNMIPIVLIGAIALVFKTFPIEAYQSFIERFAGGLLLDIFDFVFAATFGILSVYMTIFISKAYLNIKGEADIPLTGAAAAALLAFFVLAGANTEDFGLDNMGAKSMFLAILTGISATALYMKLYHRINDKRSRRIMTRGADKNFTLSLFSLLPITIVALTFAAFDLFIIKAFNVESFRQLLIEALNNIFDRGTPSYGEGLLFIFLSSLFWFFGIHGSDVLEGTMQDVFASGIDLNQAAVAAGQAPTHILTKEFFDCFVLMGGCGATICLLLAILIGSKNQSRRSLGWAASVPMLFNINELMVFGLPIIYNPVMLIPFFLTPITCYTVAYFAIDAGLVPMITGNVEWTTPVLIGGYHATGSIAGSLLQLLNITLGILIYLPFVRILDRQTEEDNRHAFDNFAEYFKANESNLVGIKLIDQQNIYGEIARELAADMHSEFVNDIVMHYQPQYTYGGRCFGVESLLRIKHPSYGLLYPPLVIKLAEEGGFLPELEEAIMLRVLDEKDRIEEKYGKGIKISFNITGTTIVTDRFLRFCREVNERTPFRDQNICIEITEQSALLFDKKTLKSLHELHEMGIALAIDDFSMGQTSMNYLKDGVFDYIKLDGSLVKGLLDQNNCYEIIRSITQLADSINMTVIAEYVETEALRDSLHEIGCDHYQGWLYSPAKPLLT